MIPPVKRPTLADDFIFAFPNKDMDARLYHLLHHATPHGHEQDIAFIMPKGALIDGKGNMIYRIGDVKDHNIMFSSHMDTVHRKAELIHPIMTEDKWVYGLDDRGDPSVLGADDKVGMYIMLRMMEEKIPGLYVFHVGEECGGIGSTYIAKQKPTYFDHINKCIAFDRKDYDNIITHQGMSRCCSDEFAEALSTALGNEFPPYLNPEPDDSGLFTDSANYTHLIEECTNISVGYFHQHQKIECFDLLFLEQLLIPALLTLDWNDLPVEREAAEDTYDARDGHNTYYGKGWTSQAKRGEERVSHYQRKQEQKAKRTNTAPAGAANTNVATQQILQPAPFLVPFKDISEATPWEKIPLTKFNGMPDNRMTLSGFKQWLTKKVFTEADTFFVELYDFLRNHTKPDNKVLGDEILIKNQKLEIQALCEALETAEEELHFLKEEL